MPSFDNKETFIIAKAGEKHGNEIQAVIALLGRHGFSTAVLSGEEFSQILGQKALSLLPPRQVKWEVLRSNHETREALPALEALTSREHFLVKEHCWQFRDSSVAVISDVQLEKIFNTLVETRPSNEAYQRGPDGRGRLKGEPRPRDGIIIRKRPDVGLPPYSPAESERTFNIDLAGYAIQVGSLLDYAQNLPSINQPNQSEEDYPISPMDEFIIGLADHLKAQLPPEGSVPSTN